MANANLMMKLIMVPVVIAVILFITGLVILFTTEDLLTGLLLTMCMFVYGIPLTGMFAFMRRQTLKIGMMASKMTSVEISVLAASTGCKEKEAREKVTWCINHGYLEGYCIVGDRVETLSSQDPGMQVHAVVCPNCNASFTYTGKIGECPYCGDYYPPKNH